MCVSERGWLVLVSLCVVTVLSVVVWGAVFSPGGRNYETPDARFADARPAAVDGSPPSPGEFTDLRRQETDERRYRTALAAYEEALKSDPDRPDIYFERAQVYREMGRYDRALSDCDAVLRLSPDDPRALKLRGRLRWIMHDLNGSMADLSRALEPMPKDPALYELRAMVHRDLGHHEAAIEDLTRAIELNPGAASGYYIRGCEYSELEAYETAIADFQMATKLKPNHCWYHVALAEVYTITGDHDDAVIRWDEFLALGANQAYGRTRRAYSLCRAERYDEAVDDIQKVLGEYSDYPPALLLLAWLSAQRGEIKQARDELRKITAGRSIGQHVDLARDATALLDAHKADEWELPTDW